MRLSLMTDEVSADLETALELAREWKVDGVELRGIGETDVREKFFGAGGGAVCACRIHKRKIDVLFRRRSGKQAELLKNKSDHAAPKHRTFVIT